MCVQRFDDSLNSAIHITYRISLRSSSMPEPRDPLLKVLFHLHLRLRRQIQQELKGATGGTPGRVRGPPGQSISFTEGWAKAPALRPTRLLVMIPPQVHLRRPCYDFYFL